MPEPDWARWVGVPYQPPHGCFVFVRQFFEEELGVSVVPALGAGVRDTALAKAIAFRDGLAAYCVPVENPKPTDIVMFGSTRVLEHIGIVVDPVHRLMVHNNQPVNRAGDWRSTIARYGGLEWRPVGFWRYSPPS